MLDRDWPYFHTLSRGAGGVDALPHREKRPPALQDFLSDRARGRPVPRDPELRRLHDGLSVYSTLAQARRKARAFPVLGRFIAVVRRPADASITAERTIPGSAGHHTLWGDAETLLDCVESVVDG